MSCNHQVINDHLYDYIEVKLDLKTHKQCQTAIKSCSTCQEKYAALVELYKASSDWEDQSAPTWNRARFAVQPIKVRLNWSNWFSLAASSLALIVVMFQIKIDTQDGLQIFFGEQANSNLQTAIDLQVTNHLEEFYQQQQLNNQILLANLLETNREERRIDLNAVINALQSQRSQDQLIFNEQLNYLTSNQIESAQYINSMVSNSGI